MQKAARQFQPTAHSARISTCYIFTAALEVNKLQHFRYSFFPLAGRHTIEAGMKFKVFMACKNRIQSRILKNDAHLTPDIGWIFYDIKTCQCSAARSRPDNSTEHPNSCSFSRAVGAQEPEYLTFLDIQIDASHSLNFAEGFSERFNFDD